MKVSSTHHHKAFGGDEVLFYAYPARSSRKREAKIIEVLTRKNKSFVGTLHKQNRTMFVRVNPRISSIDFYIEKEPEIKTVDGDRVLISFTNWDNTKSPQAKIIKVLGTPGDAETEIHTILAEHGLPYTFDPQINQEANNISEQIHLEDIQNLSLIHI